MINKKNSALVIIFLACIILLVFGIKHLVGEWIMNKNEKTLLTVDLQIAKQELLLTTVADLTRKTEADEITSRIIVDCIPDERQRFDTLLDSLSVQISNTELKELDTLFYKCGNFYSNRKAVMSARLYREVEVYNEYVKLRASLINADDPVLSERAILWLKLADSELIFADHFSTLVELQGDIITALLAGSSRDSVSITATLDEVNATRVQMTILGRQIDSYRDIMQSV